MTPKSRITALDGIRGFAIFLVIINHFSFDLSKMYLPTYTHGVWNTFMLSGPFGVNIFFILCGFLMTFLYPQVQNALNFIQKRYYRIFPLFLGISTFNIIIYIWKDTPFFLQMVLLFTIAGTIYFLWKYLLEKKAVRAFRFIFWGFVTLQIAMVVVNFFTGRLTQEEFYALPPMIEYSITYLANLTLTLWAGWNIPILSGPYWSLAPEILFYIIYPFTVIKVANRIKKLNLLIIVSMLLLSSIGVLILNEVFNQILALSLLNIVRSQAFVVGILVALLYRQQGSIWTSFSKKINSRWIDVVVLMIIPFSMFVFQFFPEKNQFNLNLLHVFLNSLMLPVFMATLMEGNLVNKFFSQRILLFLGMISYSAYLVHSHVLGGLKQFFDRQSGVMISLELICGVTITVIGAYVLYNLLEKPYFKMRKIIDFHVK